MGGQHEKFPSTAETIAHPAPVHSLTSEKYSEHDGASNPDVERCSRPPSEHTTIADEQLHDREPAIARTITPKQPLVKVSRSKRRGLFARFCLIPEVTEPTDYLNSTKWTIVFVVGIAAAAAPVGSAIILPALEQVAEDLNSSSAITNLSVALYMLSMAIFPLWWSAFSERSGRRTIYLTSFALFIVFAVLSAVSKNISMLIVMRLLSGGAAASVQAVGAGTIADCFLSEERGRAMGIFYLGPLCGPLLAPIIGGVVGETWDWRATQWVLVIYGVIVWGLIFFGLPETLKARKIPVEVVDQATTSMALSNKRPALSRTSTREAVTQRSKKVASTVQKFLIEPLHIITYLKYPAVLLTVYYSSVTFGSLYILNISISYSFEREPYNYSTLIIGLLYIPNSVGYILSSLIGGPWMDYIMKREAIKANRISDQGKLIYIPEDRMRENAWLGAVIYPAALIWYGWTVEKGVLWVAPMTANFFYGLGSMLIFAMSTTMLTEFMPNRSSSGVALNNLARNIFSCTGAIIGAPVIHAIGNGWLFTILGIWALSSAVVIWAMRRFGPRWRKNMEKAFND